MYVPWLALTVNGTAQIPAAIQTESPISCLKPFSLCIP